MKNNDLLDQLDDDLDTLEHEEQVDLVDQEINPELNQEDYSEQAFDLSSNDVENVLEDHQIPDSHQASMDRLDQLIDQEKDNKQHNIKLKSHSKKWMLLMIFGGLILMIIMFLFFRNFNRSSTQEKTQPKLQTEKNISPGSHQVLPKRSKSKLIRAKATNQSDLAQISDKQVNPSTQSMSTQSLRPLSVSNTEVQSALNFDPKSQAQQEPQQKWLKLKAINQQLNLQLKQKEELIAKQKLQLKSYQNELRQVSDQVAIAGRTRIGGLQIIDFAAAGRVAVVASQYSKGNQIIALSEGEMLKLGNSSYRVEEVNAMDSRVIIGQYYYIDKRLVSQPILGLDKKPKPAKLATKNKPKSAQDRLKPIRNWTILFASQSGDYSVIASKDNRAKRLSRGDRLSPYGRVKNILRDGSIVFTHHIIQYQSTIKQEK